MKIVKKEASKEEIVFSYKVSSTRCKLWAAFWGIASIVFIVAKKLGSSWFSEESGLTDGTFYLSFALSVFITCCFWLLTNWLFYRHSLKKGYDYFEIEK